MLRGCCSRKWTSACVPGWQAPLVDPSATRGSVKDFTVSRTPPALRYSSNECGLASLESRCRRAARTCSATRECTLESVRFGWVGGSPGWRGATGGQSWASLAGGANTVGGRQAAFMVRGCAGPQPTRCPQPGGGLLSGWQVFLKGSSNCPSQCPDPPVQRAFPQPGTQDAPSPPRPLARHNFRSARTVLREG